MSLLGFVLGAAAMPQETALRPPAPTPAQEPETEAGGDERPVPAEAVGTPPGGRTISLAQAVALALERNYVLLTAGDSVSAARFREAAARGEFHPQLIPRYQGGPGGPAFGLDASQRLPWTGGSVTAGAAFRSLTAIGSPAMKGAEVHAVVSQPLLRGAGPNATFFDLTNAKRSREGQERAFELARQRLAVDVATTFYAVVRQRELLVVSRQSLKRSESLREASDARMKVGLASKLDVFRAELQSSQTEEALVQSQAELDGALEQFRILLGLDPGDPVEPESVTLPDSIDLDIEPVEVLLARALDTRLELKEARDQVADADRAARLARQNLLPQLDFNVDFAQAGVAPTYSDSLRAGRGRVDVFLSTSYPLERSADQANRAIAEVDLAARRRALAQRELDVAGEVRAAVRNLDRIRKSAELQRKGVDFADQQVRLATLRYQRGLASNFDVVDAEGNLLSSRTALVGLLADYQVARINLFRAVGTLDVTREFAP
jgi:outer membrane protein TolC